jgi:hypothetical protein
MCREDHWRLGRQNVLGSLAAAPRRLAASMRRARGPRLRRRPAPREWSIVEVLAHLLDAEVTLGFRVRTAAAEPGADTVALARRLTPAQRRAYGRHAEYGRLRVDQLLGHWAEHDLNHLQQIQTTLKALARR